MGVRIIRKYAQDWYIDNEELIRLRSNGEEEYGFDGIDLHESPRYPKIRAGFTPGTIVEFDGKFWEILGIFRTVAEPTVWRFVCQSVPTLDAPREMPIDEHPHPWGFDWAVVLPRVVYEKLFESEEDAKWFFGPLWAPNHGQFRVFKTQELLKGRILVKVPWNYEDIVINKLQVDEVSQLSYHDHLQLTSGDDTLFEEDEACADPLWAHA